jgi:hypothetical protein
LDDSPLFMIEDEEVVIFGGKGLWIDMIDLSKLYF